MLKFFKSLDIYVHPIGVLYKGDSSYKTLLGSFFSLVTTSIVLFFAVARLIEMMDRSNQDQISRALVTDIEQEGHIGLIDHN